jgi:hypothetical protein
MNSFLDQLNLTPQERRIVVAIGMLLIVVLNVLFVWPHFSEWKRISRELQTMRANIEKYNKEIALDTNSTNGLQKQLAKLVRQEGTGVMDKQVQLQSTIMTQARKTGVNVANYNPGGARPQTNEFFEEESIKITFDSQEPQLISFLYNIGGDPAMIRVSELNLSPQDQNRYRLHGAITLTANYAKRAATPAPAAKPAPVPGTKKPASPPASAKPAPGAKPGQPAIKPAPPGQRGPQPPGPNSSPRTPFVPPKKTTA